LKEDAVMTTLGAAIVLLALGPNGTGTKVAYATQEVHPSPAPTNLTKAPTTIVDGSFARYLEAPDGRVDGIVLEDGTVARFAPRTNEVSDTTTFRRGDPIRVRGDLVLGLPLPYLVHASLSRADLHITNVGFTPLTNSGPLPDLSKTGAGATGKNKTTDKHADGTVDTSTTERHLPSPGSKPKQADDTLVGESDRLAHKRTRLKTAAQEIRRLTTGSGSHPLNPRWSRRRETDGP
jgi:hypothetical protein